MDVMSAQEMAQKWNVSLRRVQDLCKQGKIEGAYRFGRYWMIPAETKKPIDGRIKEAKSQAQEIQYLPISCPLLSMTNIYNVPGQANKAAKSIAHNKTAKELFDAEIAYLRGDIASVKEYIQTFSEDRKGVNAILGTYMLSALCALYEGNDDLWKKTSKNILTVHCIDLHDYDVVYLVHASLNSLVYGNAVVPEWFERGNFEKLPVEIHPYAKVFYARLLYLGAMSLAYKKMEFENIKGLGLLRASPRAIEPLITQAVVDQTVIPEIYLRLIVASLYYNGGSTNLAIEHIDRAINLALKDGLYMILAEHWRELGALLEERIKLIDENCLKTVKELYKNYSDNSAKVIANIRNLNYAKLSDREREVTKFVAFNFTNRQIARKLNVSEETIKTIVRNIMAKTNITNRKDFVSII